MNDLQGRVAVVTGGGAGIGFATVKRFLGAGAKVLLVDLRQTDVDTALTRLDSKSTAGFAGDVSIGNVNEEAMRKAVETFGAIDVVVLNAGIEGVVKPLLDYPESDFDRVLAVNLKGVFLGIREAAPHLHRRGGGSIVVTSSTAGLIGAPGRAAYVASEHAVLGLVKVAAIELAPLKIRVNAIAPGAVENRMMRSVEEQTAAGHPEEVKAVFNAHVPMARYGHNEEIAELALFLASTRSSYSTGGVFVADGGSMAH
jgi:NAD(P)-dependent dehydrogenase (short-subunit alcohol dehydrogenase family)